MIQYARNLIVRLASDERGLTAVEYAVLGALIVAAIGVGGVTFTDALSDALEGLI